MRWSIKAGDRIYRHKHPECQGIVVKLSIVDDTAFVKWDKYPGIREERLEVLARVPEER